MKNQGKSAFKRLTTFALIFLILAWVVKFIPLSSLETSFSRFINNLPNWLYLPLFIIMQAGAYFSVIIFSILSFIFKKKNLAMGLLFAGTIALGLAEFFKILVGRERPFKMIGQVFLRVPNSSSLGFPSSHAAVAATLATVASFYFKGNVVFVIWFVVATVAVARVYVGVHLPLDVIGGIVLGLFTRINLCQDQEKHGIASANLAPVTLNRKVSQLNL